MGPDSVLYPVAFVIGCTGLLYLVARLRLRTFRMLAGLLVVLLGMITGVWGVNRYFGYYTAWSALADDLTGSSPSFPTATDHSGTNNQVVAGNVESMNFPGALSGISRPGLVYTPPQYNDPRYRTIRFPVIELIHGTPGKPLAGINALQVNTAMDAMIAKHLVGPMVIVMPQQYVGTDFQECVDSSHAKDEVYLAQDVPNDVRAHLRVSTDPAQWAVAGVSSGGYCAANIGLRNRSRYGAVAVMDGYWLAAHGPAGQALANDPKAEAANSPLTEAQGLSKDVSPLPSFWVLAGTGNAADEEGAKAFVAALAGIQQVTFVQVPGGNHTYYTWDAAVPTMLAWIWFQIAPPGLRAQFPIGGPPTAVTITPPNPGKVTPGH